MMISARAHNRLAAEVRRKTPRLLRLPPAPYRHPWFTTATWNVEQGYWEARVQPGVVNGLDPLISGVSVPNEEGRTGQTGTDNEEVVPKMRPATLGDGAAVPLRGFREGFTDSSRAALVFFEAHQARKPRSENFSINADTGTITQKMAEEESGPAHALRAVDVYLAQARPSLRGTVDIVDATGLSGQVAEYSSAYDTSALDFHGSRARVLAAATYPGNAKKPTPMDIFAGNYTDDGEDRLPICTVFLLSPLMDDPDSAGEPDSLWMPFVQHHLFWNVGYAAQYEPPPKPPAPIRVATGLALADTLGNQILAPLNDVAARLMNAFNTRTPEGAFFTV